MQVAVTMISGQIVTDESEKILINLKNLERLATNFATPTKGIELEIFPWLKYFGHPLISEAKVMVFFYYYSLISNALYIGI